MTENSWLPIISRREHPNIHRAVLIKKQYHPKWEEIKRNHVGNFYMTSVIRALYAIATVPGSRTGESQEKSFGPLKFFYRIDSKSDVKIEWLYIDETKPMVEMQEPGLYGVRSDGDKWDTEKRPRSGMELSHKWAGAHSAAIPGKFRSKEDAGRELANHIINAYHLAFTPAEASEVGNRFSLFWINNQFENNKHVDSIVSMIQLAQRQGEKIRWLIHGESAGVFVQAMQFLIDNPKSSNLFAAQKDLGKQMVFFSNPRGKRTTEKELKQITEKAGLYYAGTQINSGDIFGNKDAWLAAKQELISIGSKTVLGGLGSALGWSAIVKSFDMASTAESIVLAMGWGVSGYVVGKEAISKVGGYCRNLPKVVDARMPYGNQKWTG